MKSKFWNAPTSYAFSWRVLQDKANLCKIQDLPLSTRILQTALLGQTSLLDQAVEDTTVGNQLFGRAKLGHAALLQHNDTVAVQNRVDPVRHRDNRPVRKQR